MALTQVQPGMLASDSQYTGFKNRIINGAMVIDQRNAGSAITPASPTYFVDRWYASVGDASKLTYQQVADAPAGFKFSTKITVAASATPTSYNFIWQPIEGLNTIDLGFGAAGAQNITVSFWIKGSVAGNYSVFLGNNAGRSYLASVPVTTSWAYQTVSIPGDTSGTWATTNAAGMYLGFDLGADAPRYSTAGSWLGSNVYGVTGNVKFVSQANGSTLNITGVQLEKGSTATSFDYRPYGTELQLCQRYYEVAGAGAAGKANSAGNTGDHGICLSYKVAKRATPTLSIISGTNALVIPQVNTYSISAITGINGTVNGAYFNVTTTASLGATNVPLIAYNEAWLGVSAEL